ncbi:MAG: hypothetical protein K0U19_02740 [Proteobacteria bacterium]|nr:hypothetical protein [Pseudomonadota bacterium]
MSVLVNLKKRLGDKPHIRCKSMIITIMGDVVFVHGEVVDMASIISLNTLFDIGKHSSRIAISRLTTEDWLRQQRTGERNGNRYRFSNKGLESFRQSAALIYSNQPSKWTGDWQLLLLNTNIHVKTMRQFIRAIGWLGYGKMQPTVYLCPTQETNDINQLIADYGLEKKVSLFRSVAPSDEENLKQLAERLWNIKAMQKEYAAFMRKFEHVENLLPQVTQDPAAAMHLRLRLVHEYRRLILHTPPLPKNVRNDFFHADAAFEFCADMYHQLLQASEEFITHLPGCLTSLSDSSLMQRFRQTDNNATAFAVSPAIRLHAKNLIR